MLPGIERQPRKKLEPSPERLLAVLPDELPILDPATNTVTSFHAPVRDLRDAAIARGRARRDRGAGNAVGLVGVTGRSGTRGSTTTT